MQKIITESDIEENVLDILKSLGYEIIRGDNEKYLPGGNYALRRDYKDIVLVDKLRYALKKINPSISEEDWLKKALRKAIEDLKENVFAGENISKKLIPKEYIKRYKITNIWKYE